MEPKFSKAENVFDSINSINLNKNDGELASAPMYQEIVTKYAESETKKYDDSVINDILYKIDLDEYKCKSRSLQVSEISDSNNESLNEHYYSISYSSNFDGIRTDKCHYVDVFGKEENSVKTIAEALNMSLSGDTILLYPGTYNESLILNKSVEIKSVKPENKGTTIINSGISDAFNVNANGCRISDLTLNCKAAGDSYCIRVSSGVVELENCNVHSDCAGCIRTEESTKINARKCNFTSRNYAWTSLSPNSTTLFDNCTFTSESSSSPKTLVVDQDATCLIIECNINGSITFKQNSKGMVRKSIIQSEKGSNAIQNGIVVQNNASPLIKDSDISGFKAFGILLLSGSKTIVAGSTIHDNEGIGISSRGSEDFVLMNNTVKNNKLGVWITQGSDGTMIKNDITENSTGILIDNNSKLTLRKSKIYKNLNFGMEIKSDPTVDNPTNVTVIDSEIYENGNIGISCVGGYDVTLNRTRIFNNTRFGFCCDGCGKGSINDSYITKNDGDSQIRTSGNSSLEINGTHFSDSNTKVIVLSKQSQVIITNCKFQGNKEPIIAAEQSRLEIVNSIFDENPNKCVVGLNSSTNIIRNSTFKNNKESYMGNGNSTVEIDYCNFYSNKTDQSFPAHSIYLQEAAKAHLNNSTFDKLLFCIKVLGEGVQLNIENSKFLSGPPNYCAQGTSHIIIDKARTLMIKKCEFIGKINDDYSESGISINSRLQEVIIEETEFKTLPKYGINLINTTNVSISKCNFVDCFRAAACLYESQNIVIAYCNVGNEIPLYGYILDKNSKGMIIGGNISNVRMKPIFVNGGSTVDVRPI